MAGDNVRAGQWFSVAAVIEPLNAHHIYYLGQAALARGAGDEALALLNRTVQLNPSFAFYRRELAAAALRANDPHLAASELQQAIRLEPFETEGSAAFLLGRLLWRTGQHSNARAYLALALNLNPTLAGDPFWTAVDDGQLRDELLRESVDECTTLYSDPTRQAEAFLRLHRLAHAWSAAGQPARGATALEWVLTESPASRQTRIELTQLYLDMDQVNSAREVMAGALALEPLYPAYMNAMARVLVRTGDVEGAIAMFEQALRHWTSISLDNYVAHLYLERLYAATGQQELADIEARKLRFIRSKLPEQQRDFEIHTGGDVDELRELEHELRRQTAAAGRQET